MENKYYTSCEDLPLNLYITCQVDNDLSALVIEGAPSEEELKSAWENITEEYYDLAGESLDTYTLGLYFEVQAMNVKIEVIEQCLSVLKKYYCPDLVEILKQHGYPLKEDETNDQYISALEKIQKRSKVLLIQLQDKFSHLEKIKSSKKKGDKITRKYYGKLLAHLSKFFQFQISSTKVTVSEYAAYLNEYITASEQVKTVEDGRG
jgi:hypothetical protein